MGTATACRIQSHSDLAGVMLFGKGIVGSSVHKGSHASVMSHATCYVYTTTKYVIALKG